MELKAASDEGRVSLIDGDRTIYPGVTLKLGGYHTPGHQYVVVNSPDGNIVLAGDACYLYENVLRLQPIGLAVDYGANLATIQQMIRTAASPMLVIPGHDGRVIYEFPEVAEDIVEIGFRK